MVMTMTETPETAPLTNFKIVGVVEKEIGINAGTPAARMVPGGSCWHCGTSIRICVQAKNLETGEVVDIGTTCAERIGLDKNELKSYLAERFAEQRYLASKAYNDAKRAEMEKWEAEQESKFGPHGTESRFVGGCSRGIPCDECRQAAPHGTSTRFWDALCSCDACVDAAMAQDKELKFADRPVLVNIETGKVVDGAKLISGQYGTSWGLPNYGGFVPSGRKRRSTIVSKGYTYAHAQFIVRRGRTWSDSDWPVRRLSVPTVDDFGEPIPHV